jgi:outer membrane protein
LVSFYRKLRVGLLAATGMAAVLAPLEARAESLAEALALAYRSNPGLQSQRALQRQLDETYVQARAGWRPTASASLTTAYSEVPDLKGKSPDRNSLGAALTATQPLYTGGRVGAAVDAAEAAVQAGREQLRAQEQSVLQSVISAYQDVLRDQQVLLIRQSNRDLLQNQLSETQAKLEVGQLTRTEVAQSEAQLAAARALYASAQAQLQISRATYASIVGQNPAELTAPTTLPGLPETVDLAFSAAEDANPTLRRARLTEQSSRFKVAQARAGARPTVSLQATLGATGPITPLDQDLYSRAVSASAVITQPLFTGGIVSSNIRSALEQNTSDRIQIENARRNVVQLVSQAWNTMLATGGNVVSNREQVRAATIAFEGFQEQYRVGLATNLDVLIAQQNLQNAQLSLVQSIHDQYVAQAALLNAMGRLDARSLVSGAPLYDPAANFQRVKNSNRVPWEPLVEALDGAGAPSAGQPRELQPLAAEGGPVTLNPATVQPPTPEGQPLSTAVPTLSPPT